MARFGYLSYKLFSRLAGFLSVPLQLFALIMVRILAPVVVIRIGWINSTRIGHMAANTDLRLCLLESGIAKPRFAHLDIWCCTQEKVCNRQLLAMWKRRMLIFPKWAVSYMAHTNLKLPGGEIHHIDEHTDRDIFNLWDKYPPQISFTKKELIHGEKMLRQFGLEPGSKFVCLIVRDDAYLDIEYPNNDWAYHEFRNSDINRCVLAAEELANRGYYVFRMGARVNAKFLTENPRIIDYATNGMRSDFMDIYLGAKCEFCISTSTGYDAVPIIFRRPIVYINFVPVGWLPTYSKRFLAIFKHHLDMKSDRELSLKEIIDRNVAFCSTANQYVVSGVRLEENTAEEIRDVVIEMEERLTDKWIDSDEYLELQEKFWSIFPSKSKNESGMALHGQLFSRFGAKYLLSNRWWLE